MSTLTIHRPDGSREHIAIENVAPAPHGWDAFMPDATPTPKETP